jgi:uncharacterized membrane protein
MLIALLTYEALTWFGGQQELPGLDTALLLDWRTVTLGLLWALYPCIFWARTKLRPRLWTLAAAHYTVLGIAWLTLLTDFHHRETMVFLNPVLIAAALLPAGMLKVSNKITDVNPNIRVTLQIFAHLMIVALISVELYQGLFMSGWSPASREWIRMALISAAWSTYATAVLSVGISRDLQSWRWLGLGLLGATLLKVFFIDMAEVRQIWRVLSFVVLGALLMACSYVYSRHGSRKRLTGQPPGGVL